MKRYIVIGLLLLGGCSERYRNAIHPDYAQADYERDWYECRRDNSYAHTTVAIVGRPPVAYRDYPMARACMRERGWQRED